MPSMMQPAIAAQVTLRSKKSHERSSAGLDHAWADRRRDHDGLPDRIYAHGIGYGVWFSRLLGARGTLVGQQDLRSDGAAHLWRHGERHSALGAAVRVHGLYHGTGRAGRSHVPQR